MNKPFKKHPLFKARQQWRTPQKASESAAAICLRELCLKADADEIRFVKIDRRSLTTIGLLAGWLMIVLMAGGCSKQAVKDPRLQSPRVEVFKAKAVSSNSRTFTGIVEARVQSDLGFRVGGKILERSVNVGERVQKGQILMRLDSVDLRLKPHEDLTFLDSLSHIDGSLQDFSRDSEAQVALHSGFHDSGEGSAIRASRFRLENLYPRRLQARIFHGLLGTSTRHQDYHQPSCKQTNGHQRAAINFHKPDFIRARFET